MPLYDVVCLFKVAASRKDIIEILTSVGKRVYAKNGVVTGITSYGTQPLGYQIKRQGTRFNEAHMMQMTFMAPTSFVDELHVLRQDSRLLRHTVLRNKPFWKEEVVDNQLWAHKMNEAFKAKGRYMWDEKEDVGVEGDGEKEAMEEGGYEDEGYENDDLEFAADGVGAADADYEEAEGSGRRRVDAGHDFDSLSTRGAAKDTSPASEALAQWRNMFKERQAQRRRSQSFENDD